MWGRISQLLSRARGNDLPPHPDAMVAVAERLHTAALQILRSVQRTDPARDFGRARLSALSTLATKRILTLGALASLERVTPQTMSKVVQALVRDSLAARTRSPRDRRSL